MTERLISGVLTAISLCITAIVVAFFLSMYRGGPGIPESIALWTAVPTLLLFLGAIGFVVGAILGTERVATLLSHLWATAQPKKPLFTFTLWLLVVVLWLFAYRFA